MTNFWQNLKKPFFALAPMEGVTDVVFRQIIAEVGTPDVFFTEFTNTDGLVSQGFERVARRLEFTKDQHPIVAQIWGNNPSHYEKAVKIIEDMGFDGIDINMGCPVRDVVGKGFCSGLINNPKLAREIIQSAKQSSKLPVSVKTRIGYNSIKTEEWIGFLLEQDVAAVTIHGRTTKEMSKVPAHWDEIGKAVRLRNKMKSKTLIIGNGDVLSLQDAKEKVGEFGVDGVMIARGIFHNPWIFNEKVNIEHVSVAQKIALLKKHIMLFDKTWGNTKDFNLMKKFYKVYINGFPNASEFREKLMTTTTVEQTMALFDSPAISYTTHP